MNNIKSILTQIATASSEKRLDKIKQILAEKKICFITQNFKHGENIEIFYQGCNDNDVILMAHHDISSGSQQGANDNTSSVAVLIAVAEYLHTVKPYYNVRIVLSDNEECLGALLSKSLHKNDILKLITTIGSYNYLRTLNKNKIKAVFNLELSGIGDSIYIATKSGYVQCHNELINFLSNIARHFAFKNKIIDISHSDMISIHTLSLPGTVFGAIPYDEMLENKASSAWSNIHTNRDSVVMINDQSLNMIYEFSLAIINSIKAL